MKLYFENKRINEDISDDEILDKLISLGFTPDAWYIIYNSGRPVKYSTEVIGPFTSRKLAYAERALNWSPMGFNETSSVKKGSEILTLAANHSIRFYLDDYKVEFDWDPMK